MDRLERLINLTAALLEAERPLTADELHQRLPGYAENAGAFRRAFERDKDVLREMGVPLVLEPVDPVSQPGVEGYRIAKGDAYLKAPAPDPDELARLLVDADHGGWAVGQVGADAVESRDEDGSEVLAVTVTNRGAFRSFVLGFLDHAEVLDPPDLRDDLVSWLEQLCGA